MRKNLDLEDIGPPNDAANAVVPLELLRLHKNSTESKTKHYEGYLPVCYDLVSKNWIDSYKVEDIKNHQDHCLDISSVS
jgi:hypothetical protein